MQKIEVKIPNRPAGSYCIEINAGALGKVLGQIETLLPQKKLFIVTDSNVEKAGHLKTLLAGHNLPSYVISPAGEESKQIATVTKIIEKMEQKALGRDCAVIALGGGTVGDMAGFAAAIYKRGVPVVQIPTTTLAQADSAIGAKTGVDSSISKNAFGAFYHPTAVFIDVDTLKTLPKEDFNGGLVESIKHALIADAEYFKYFQNNLDDILAKKTEALEFIANKNCRIKAAVVEEDPYEKNKRRILNYGHTIGHAVESASNYKLQHGQSVAIGIIAAGIIEQKLGLGSTERTEQIKDLFNRLDLELAIPKQITKQQLMDIISRDKKAVNKWPRFVLLEDIGKVLCKDGSFAHEVAFETVEETIEILLQAKS